MQILELVGANDDDEMGATPFVDREEALFSDFRRRMDRALRTLREYDDDDAQQQDFC